MGHREPILGSETGALDRARVSEAPVIRTQGLDLVTKWWEAKKKVFEQ